MEDIEIKNISDDNSSEDGNFDYNIEKEQFYENIIDQKKIIV